MCGIAGYISNTRLSENVIDKMISKLEHRGPDSSGIWRDESTNLVFGHKRLSILDLSSAGHQPMQSKSGRYVITYNGEIYNHLALRNELMKIRPNIIFRGTSDTETLLNCLDEFGLRESIHRFEGMFAMCILDRQLKKLYLVRDRFGEKPLYFQSSNNFLIFASEINALKQNPHFDETISFDALDYYFRKGFTPPSKSILKNVHKVLPGHYYEFDLDDLKIKENQYWSASIQSEKNNSKFSGSFDDATNQLESLLCKSIQDKLISDVPLGIFLSGGLDSSVITAITCKKIKQDISTFSIGLIDHKWDESKFARNISKELGSNHHELSINERDIIDLIPNISKIYHEPISDTSQIPTYLVSKFARENVTVALSGDGGDELFGGYSRYINGQKVINASQFLPKMLRKKIKNITKLFFKSESNPYMKGFSLIDYEDNKDLYRKITAFWHNSPINFDFIDSKSLNYEPITSNLSFQELAMLNDTISYLPESVLAKVDRASMSVSLESRAPFLDSKLFDFAWSLPIPFKIKGNESKFILKKLLSRFLDPIYFDRPKMGFGLPIGDWLNSALRDWSNDLIISSESNLSHILDIQTIKNKLEEHHTGKHNHANQLWSVLMFIDWHNNFYNE